MPVAIRRMSISCMAGPIPLPLIPPTMQAFTLKDVPILEQALQQYPAALVVIDPLQAYLGTRGYAPEQ